MRVLKSAGELIFGVAIIGFGCTQLIFQETLSAFFPIPNYAFGYHFWVNFIGVFFLISGLAYWISNLRRLVLGFISSFFLLTFLIFHIVPLSIHLHDPQQWTRSMEVLAICSGSWIIFLNQQKHVRLFRFNQYQVVSPKLGFIVFGTTMIIFGIQHFQYASFIEGLIPKWIPQHQLLTYITRFGFILAGISLLIRVGTRLSLLLLGSMFLIWVLVLHLPRAISMYKTESEWSSLFIAMALAGIAWASTKTYTKKEMQQCLSFMVHKDNGRTKQIQINRSN